MVARSPVFAPYDLGESAAILLMLAARDTAHEQSCIKMTNGDGN
jgi:hypothetical protein